MNSVGELLRRAREEQGRSLDDIASATRIHRKFLEQVEQGSSPDLPPAYVRAFIRAYAAEVNLDPAEMLKLCDQSGPAGSEPHEQIQAVGSVGHRNTPQRIEQNHSVPSRRVNNKQGKVLVVFSVLLLVGLILSVYWLRRGHSAEPVKEIVFQDMVKEWEGKKDSAAAHALPPADSALGGGHVDSLSLVGLALDTVWMRFAIDKAPPRELILKPKQQVKLRAKDKFLVTLGNAGGISFTLNGTAMAPFGKRGKPAGNILIGRDMLARLQNPPSQ